MPLYNLFEREKLREFLTEILLTGIVDTTVGHMRKGKYISRPLGAAVSSFGHPSMPLYETIAAVCTDSR